MLLRLLKSIDHNLRDDSLLTKIWIQFQIFCLVQSKKESLANISASTRVVDQDRTGVRNSVRNVDFSSTCSQTWFARLFPCTSTESTLIIVAKFSKALRRLLARTETERRLCRFQRQSKHVFHPTNYFQVMPKATRGAFYAVNKGREPGVYLTWYDAYELSFDWDG
jgi:hypothetical protein